MLIELLQKREELLDEVEHACLQIRHMAKRDKRPTGPPRMPQAHTFDFQALLTISEGP